MRKVLAWVCACGVLSGVAQSAGAVETDAGPASASAVGLQSEAPIAFRCDLMQWDRSQNVIRGIGHVQIEQNTHLIQGDRIDLFLDRSIAELYGTVAVTEEGQTVVGTHATYNFAEQSGTFERPRTFVDPWYISADDFIRESETEYRSSTAQLTTCKEDPPPWRLTAGEVRLELPPEGQQGAGTLHARNVVGRIGRVPILYLPAYSHNLDREDPAITLQVGQRSEVGAFARIGYPYDVSPNVRLEPQLHLYTQSGVGGGLNSEGTAFDGRTEFATDLFYINDLNSENWRDDPDIEPNRFRVDAYSRTELPYNLVFLKQIQYVSDRETMKTFFWQEFLEREENESFLDLTQTNANTIFNIHAERRLDTFTNGINQLPQIEAHLLEYRVGSTPLFIDIEKRAGYYEIEPEGYELFAAKSDVRFSTPYRVNRWVNLVPFVEMETRYHSDGNFGSSESATNLWWREGISAQSRMHHVYDWPLPSYDQVRHLFIPTVTYAHRSASAPDVEDIALFDPIDLNGPEDSVEVELRNLFEGRRPDGTIHRIGEYDTTLTFEFHDGTDHLATVEHELAVRPSNHWLISARALNDYRRETTSSEVSGRVTYSPDTPWSVFVGVEHDDGVGEPYRTEISYGGEKQFNDQWAAGFEQRFVLDNPALSRSGGLSYQEYWVKRMFSCWSLTFFVLDRNESTAFYLELGLEGLTGCDEIGAPTGWGRTMPPRNYTQAPALSGG